jgi:hypothetical protein
MMKKSLLLSLSVALSMSASLSYANEPVPLYIENNIATFRSMLGKPLLDAVNQFNNEQRLILEKLAPQGASFFLFPNEKVPGEPFDSLRQRTYLSLAMTTCAGSKDLDAKISSVSVWEGLYDDPVSKDTGDDGSDKREDRLYIAFHLQRLLELMNPSSVISTPSSLRAPRVSQLKGIVFEYVRGDLTETLSLVNDLSEASMKFSPRFNWQTSNSSFCPK